MTPSTPASTSQSRYPQLESILRTEDGFKRSIRYTSGADTALIAILALALLGVFYNVLTTLDSLDKQKLPWGEYFWEMLFVVRNTSGNIDPIFWATVWLPIIAVPLMLILLIVSKVTRPGAIRKVYEQYCRAGFVADLMSTGVSVNFNNSTGLLCLFTAPNVPPDWAQSAIQHLRNQGSVSTDTLSGAVISGFGKEAVQAKVVDPSLPEGIYITGQQKNNKSLVRIAVPKGNDYTRLKLWPLKKNVPIA